MTSPLLTQPPPVTSCSIWAYDLTSLCLHFKIRVYYYPHYKVVSGVNEINTCQMNKTKCLFKKRESCLNLLFPIPFLLSFFDPLPSVLYSLCCFESNFVQVTKDLHVVDLILSLWVTWLTSSLCHSSLFSPTWNTFSWFSGHQHPLSLLPLAAPSQFSFAGSSCSPKWDGPPG